MASPSGFFLVRKVLWPAFPGEVGLLRPQAHQKNAGIFSIFPQCEN